MIAPKFGFKLHATIDFEDQKEIIRLMTVHGIPHPLIHHEKEAPCMRVFPLRVFDIKHSAVFQRELYSQTRDAFDLDDLFYINRCNPELNWHWVDHPLAMMVKKEVDKLANLYEFIGRVSVLITDLNTIVPFHREWMYGNNYEEIKLTPAAYFQNKSLNVSPFEANLERDFHQKQGYFACKIPLTSVKENNGESRLEFSDGTIKKYSVKNHFFCLNEIEMKHGVGPTNFLRGVIYIDGKLKLSSLMAAFHSPLEVV